MMRIKNSILIVIMGFVSGMSAMDYEAVKKVRHSKMIEALTFDAAKGRYYYKPIFKRTAPGVYASMLVDFPKDQVCVDLGPAKLFWILRGRRLVKAGKGSAQDDLSVKYGKDQKKRFGNDDYPLIPQAQQRVKNFKDLGTLEYDPESGVYFHNKHFTAENLAAAKKVSSSESASDNDGSSQDSCESEEDDKRSGDEEWLQKVTILSFDREKRQYYYEHLFIGGKDTEGLKLNRAPATIDRGPLRRLITSLDYSGYDNFRGLYFFINDHTQRLLEKQLGDVERDKGCGLLYHTKVFELTD